MAVVENLEDYGVFTWRREGAVVHWSFVGHDVGKPPKPDQIAFAGTYSAEAPGPDQGLQQPRPSA